MKKENKKEIKRLGVLNQQQRVMKTRKFLETHCMPTEILVKNMDLIFDTKILRYGSLLGWFDFKNKIDIKALQTYLRSLDGNPRLVLIWTIE